MFNLHFCEVHEMVPGAQETWTKMSDTIVANFDIDWKTLETYEIISLQIWDVFLQKT